jgi:hypothetical protein
MVNRLELILALHGMRPHWRNVAAFVACAGLLGQVQGFNAPPVPLGSRVSAVGDNMVVNGIPASVHEAEVRATTVEVVEFYKDRLVRRKEAPVISRGGHEIVSGWLEGKYVTVVVAPSKRDGYSIARIMQSDMTKPVQRTPPSQLPPGSKVHSQVDSMDAGRVSSVLVFSNSSSIDANVDHIASSLKNNMNLEVTEAAPSTRAGQASKTVYFSNGRGADAVLTAMVEGSKTTLTLHTLSTLGGDAPRAPQSAVRRGPGTP